MKGAIFDVDGTLLDTMGRWETVAAEYLTKKGIKTNEDVRQKTKKMSVHQAAEYFRITYKIDESVEEIASGIFQIVSDFYLYEAMVKPGVLEFLEYLKSQDIGMCVATATDEKWVVPALKRAGLYSYFSKIFTCTAIGYGKDTPHIYEAAQQHLGLEKADVWVFEDAAHAAQTAKNAGFKVCGIFDRTESEQEQLKMVSDIYLNQFKEANPAIFM